MKKGLYASLLCALLLSVLLAGCVRLTIDPSPQELMGFQEDVLAAYDEAARLYDWFDLAPMPLDESDSVREGENTYFRVLDEAITSTEELRSRLARRLAAYKVPRYLLFLDQLPKTITGKIRPAELARLVRERLAL